MRPSSVGDFNEVDEDGWNINQMPDHEVLAEFEKMLENMNLSEVKFTMTLHVKPRFHTENRDSKKPRSVFKNRLVIA